jgi:hypothetical protein
MRCQHVALVVSVVLSVGLGGCASVVGSDSNSRGSSGIVVKIDPQSEFTSVNPGAPSRIVDASVSNDPVNAGVTWSLAGSPACSNTEPCGLLASIMNSNLSETYTPPTLVPASALLVTLTATSVTDKTKSDSFTFSVVASSVSLKGNYAFLVRGYDASGAAMAMAGSIALDGKGNITGGEFDLNDGGTITAAAGPVTGTYTLDSSFNGVARGTLTFQTAGASQSVALKYALSADGTRGKVIEYDSSGFLNSGEILLQDPSSLAAANAAGTYAFGVNSYAPAGQRVAEAGQFILGAAGVTGGAADLSQAGAASPVFAAITAAAGTATADANGRGTLTLTTNGNGIALAYYLVNSGQLELIEIDKGGPLGTVDAGTARKQATLSASSVNATSVMQMTGVDAPVGTQNFGPAVIIGVMNISGASAFNLTFDSNDIGTILTTHPETGSVTSFDPTTGRGVIAVGQGFASGFVDSAVFYLNDSGTGFIIDDDVAAATGGPLNGPIVNRGYGGTFTAQTGGPFSAQSLSGNLLAVSGASASDSIPNIEAGANFDAATGAFTAEADVTSLASQIGQDANVMFGGSASVTDVTLGHGNATVPSGFFGNFNLAQSAPATFYLIAPNQMVVIGTLSGTASGVSFFDPQ